MTSAEPLLELAGLSVWNGDTALVDDVSFAVAPGERVGVVGESGSGKSLTAAALSGLLPEGLRATGQVRLATAEPSNLLEASERQLAAIHGAQLGLVFQEPLTALDPLQRVGDQVAETLRVHARGAQDRRAATPRVLELLEQVGLPQAGQLARSFPHQLSGGQRQRVMIASALAGEPALLVCDEPTSALDVTVQARILDLLVQAAAVRDAGLLLITHDLAVAAERCDRVVVLADGAVAESGPVRRVLGAPTSSHTQSLVEAVRLRPRATGSADPGALPADAEPPPADTKPRPAGAEPLLAVCELGRSYRRPRRSVTRHGESVEALRDVSFELAAGARFGVVGESGSGKSTLVRLLAGLDQPTSGSIRYAGREITGLPERRLRFLREDLQLVFQDPSGSLDPRMRVADIIAEPLRGSARTERVERVAELLDAVELPVDAGDRYPHQFSGGQRQRISIARALAPRPRLLLADEPVSALDASVRAQVLDLLSRIADERQLTVVFVSHDLTVIRHVCDEVAVLARGEIVERGPVERVYATPEHPYTRELLAAVPDLDTAIG